MSKRDIKNGWYGWYEYGAMQKIHDLPTRQKPFCIATYIAITSHSAKSNNSTDIYTYLAKIAEYAGVSRKTARKCLTILEELGIIKVPPQERASNGKFKKLEISLVANVPTVGTLSDESTLRSTSEKRMARLEKKLDRAISTVGTFNDESTHITNKVIKGEENSFKKNFSSPTDTKPETQKEKDARIQKLFEAF